MVESERDLGTTLQHDACYFLCNLAATGATTSGTYIRDHWLVESTLHWILDVTFREDGCRNRDGHGP